MESLISNSRSNWPCGPEGGQRIHAFLHMQKSTTREEYKSCLANGHQLTMGSNDTNERSPVTVNYEAKFL